MTNLHYYTLIGNWFGGKILRIGELDSTDNFYEGL